MAMASFPVPGYPSQLRVAFLVIGGVSLPSGNQDMLGEERGKGSYTFPAVRGFPLIDSGW